MPQSLICIDTALTMPIASSVAPTSPVRILVVDDHTLFRRGLTALLSREAQFEVVGDAADAGEALRRAQELQPDLILLDNHLPGVRGVDALPALREAAPSARVLMLTVSEDEQDLAVSIGEGSIQARDRMVRANLRLVVNIARGYTGKGLSLQDLIEEGNLGLLRAVEGFDPAIGTRFSTYASYWIKQSIKRALINSAKTIRIPAYMVELLSKWRRASTRLGEELGRTPTPEEIARVLGLPRKKLPIIKKAIRIYNLTPQTDQAEAGWSLGEMVMDDRVRTPEDELVENDNLTHVLTRLETMDQREATVLRMRFGLEDNEPRTLKEIGERLGLTRERVRQIETEALGKLAEAIEGPEASP